KTVGSLPGQKRAVGTEGDRPRPPVKIPNPARNLGTGDRHQLELAQPPTIVPFPPAMLLGALGQQPLRAGPVVLLQLVKGAIDAIEVGLPSQRIAPLGGQLLALCSFARLPVSLLTGLKRLAGATLGRQSKPDRKSCSGNQTDRGSDD